MSKKTLYFFVLQFVFIIGYSQEIPVNTLDSHEKYVKLLENSKDLKYNEILKRYNDYIKRHPNNITVQVYKCKFIGSAYYDAYEDYDLNYEETASCLNSLFEKYPKNPEVLVYKLENTYGEEKQPLLESTISDSRENKIWSEGQKSRLYELATTHYNGSNDSKVVLYGKLAEGLNDSLDLSVVVSRAHLNLGDKDAAKRAILNGLNHDQDAWQLKDKADFLVEIGEHKEALKMFSRVNEKDSTLTNNTSLYEIFLGQEKYDIARGYLVKDTIYEWNRIEKIQNLFNHDLEYSTSDIALLTYRRLQKESFYDDFLGVKRFKLFLKKPFLPVSIDDFLHVIILLVCIVVLFLVPYLWILPIYSASKLFIQKVAPSEPDAKSYWNLKDFWLFSFVYLAIQFFVVLAYYYEENINYYFDLTSSYVDETIAELDIDVANGMLVYIALLFIATLFFLNKTKWRYVLNTNLGFFRMIAMSIGFVVFNAILLKILGSFIDLTDMTSLIKALNARVEIKAILSEYGLLTSILFVALIAPLYEEVIFRGIVLSATRKRLCFAWANVIQAFFFALIHFNMNLFIFYFIFGIVTGLMVKKTKGLLTGFFFHAINNLFVVLVLYMAMRLMAFG